MAIITFDHFNIKAPEPLLGETRDFYCDVLGLREGYRPAFDYHGYWLYSGQQAVLHLAEADIQPGAVSHFNHIAFRCADLESVQLRLQRMDLPFQLKSTPDGGQKQLFIHDPCGIRIELST